MTARIFISYARKDGRDLALRLKTSLEAVGQTVWLDTSEIDGGASWSRDIENAVDACETILALLSKESYKSEICRSEQLRALRKKKRLIPVLVQADAERPIHVESLNYRDFSESARYDESFALLRADLSSAHIAPEFRRAPNTAPVLPNHFVERPQELEALRQAVLSDRTDRRIALTALRGMGGIGKSVLANALCHDDAVRDAFPDGVFWVEIGREVSNLVEKLKTVALALGDNAANYASYDLAVSNFRLLLPQKSALIVLDDVWERGVITPFLVESPRSRWLVTTRDGNISAGLGATEVKLGTLDAGQALSLLRGWAGRDDARFAEIADKLDYHPLALKLVGARLRDGMTATEWIDSYDGIARVKLGRNPKTADESIELCFDASMTALSDDDRPLYHALGIFPEDVWIPEKIIMLFWRKRAGLSAADCADILTELERLALVERDIDQRAVRMHDLLHSYNRHKIRDQYAALQTEFVAALGDLYALPDDYAWRNLAYHLIEAGQADRMYSLLTDYRWLQAKLDATDANVLESDCTAYLEAVSDGNTVQPVRLIRSALMMSGHVLNEDKSTLAHQLVGRLMTWRRRNLAIHSLTETIMTEVKGLYPTFPDSDYPVLEQAGGALIRILTGHKSGVNHVVLTLDGCRAVSASGDHFFYEVNDSTVRVWDLETGALLHTLTGHTRRVNHVALTPDGRQAVSASNDRTVRVWDLETGALLHTLTGHTRKVNHVALTPDGRQAVSTSDDKTVRVWDLETGKLMQTLTGHTSMVNHVVLTPDGRQAVSASWDKTVRVWDLETGALLHTLTGHTSKVNHVALTPDGRQAVSTSDDRTVRVWDLETGVLLHTLIGHRRRVYMVALTLDGQQAVSASSDETVCVWHLETGALLHTLIGHISEVNHVALTPDGQWVVSASDDRTVRVWDLETGALLHTLNGHSGKVHHVALSADDGRVVSASYDGTMRVWSLDAEVILHTLKGHSSRVTHIALIPNVHRVVSTSSDETVRVWNLESGELIHTLTAHTASVNYIALTPNGRLAVSVSDDHTVRVWNLETGALMNTLTEHTDEVNYVSLTPDGRWAVSASSDKTMRVWDIEIGALMHTLIGHTKFVEYIALTPDGRRAVSASHDKTLRVWDLETGALTHTLMSHTNMWYVALTPDGRRAVSALYDETLRVWDIETGTTLRVFDHTEAGLDAFLQEFPEFKDDKYFQYVNHSLTWDGDSLSATGVVFRADANLISPHWVIPGQTLVAGDETGRVIFLRVRGGGES